MNELVGTLDAATLDGVVDAPSLTGDVPVVALAGRAGLVTLRVRVGAVRLSAVVDGFPEVGEPWQLDFSQAKHSGYIALW